MKKTSTFWDRLDLIRMHKKEKTYFNRFSCQIGQNNLRMMRSMSIFMMIISLFVLASTFTYFEDVRLRKIYIPIIIFEAFLLIVLHLLLRKEVPPKVSMALASFYLLHMLVISGYIGVVYCQNETALIFVVVLTISSSIFTLPTTLTMSISTASTIAMICASYFVKESYWFESDTLNGICVLVFSFLLGFKMNQMRADEAFARADMLRLNEELKKTSVTDALTGLYNHRSFQDHYYKMFRRAREQGKSIGVIMMDLDNFKSFNDHYGHVAGDACLRSVASAIAKSLPKSAIVCRYGGEEFIALLNEDVCNEAKAVGEAVRIAVIDLKIPHVYGVRETEIVTISLGAYAGVPIKGEQPMAFVEKADRAMYQSKTEGRNRLTVTLA